MYNRKFNIKEDFSQLNKLENEIMPIVRNIENREDRDALKNYILKIFHNQWKA